MMKLINWIIREFKEIVKHIAIALVLFVLCVFLFPSSPLVILLVITECVENKALAALLGVIVSLCYSAIYSGLMTYNIEDDDTEENKSDEKGRQKHKK